MDINNKKLVNNLTQIVFYIYHLRVYRKSLLGQNYDRRNT